MSTRRTIAFDRAACEDDPQFACKIAKARAGGPVALGRKFGLTPQAVTAWKIVPAKYVRRLSQWSGVPCRFLRPDLYGPMRSSSTREPSKFGRDEVTA